MQRDGVEIRRSEHAVEWGGIEAGIALLGQRGEVRQQFQRDAFTMAMPRTAPALICAPVGTMASISSGTWPPTVSLSAGAMPL